MKLMEDNDVIKILMKIKKKNTEEFLETLGEISKVISFSDITVYPLELTTVFPIQNTIDYDTKNFNNLITELTNISGEINLPLGPFGNIPVSFYLTDSFASRKIKKRNGKKSRFLVIETKTEIDLKKVIEESDIKTPFNIKPEFIIPSYYKLIHKKCITHFLYMTQIAYPGSLFLDEAMVFSGDKQIDKINGISSVLFEYDFENNKWPNFETLSIKDVWNYVINKTTILKEFSNSRIERALNSFTYLFSENYHDSIPVSLFWALSGLESLFVVGEAGITQQLNDKIQTFLGNITENKKLIKKLYNYRSSLIHGDLSIPINNGLMNNQQHDLELYDMNSLASIILVASLQKIIKNNITELNFKYIYE